MLHDFPVSAPRAAGRVLAVGLFNYALLSLTLLRIVPAFS